MSVVRIIIVIKKFLNKLKENNVSAFSAQAAFFIIISFFPFVMFLLTLLQYLPFQESDIQLFAKQIMPDGINSFVFSVIKEIYDKASGTIISITAVTALWTASKGCLAIVRGLNSVYGIKETRNYVKLRLVSTLYTLVFAVILIATMALLLFGNTIVVWISAKFPLLQEVALLVISLRTTVMLCLLALFFVCLYKFIPNRDSTLFAEAPGAIFSAAGWMGFSYLYSYYIEHIKDFSYMYGSLTAVVLFMLWLYACMYILFIGAMANVVIQEKITVYHISKEA